MKTRSPEQYAEFKTRKEVLDIVEYKSGNIVFDDPLDSKKSNSSIFYGRKTWKFRCLLFITIFFWFTKMNNNK